jgi:hypothetical protein
VVFHKGDKVACIDDCFQDSKTNPFRIYELNLPVFGLVYTIREVIDTRYGQGIRLHEIRNKRFYYQDRRERLEPAFEVAKFELLSA